MNKINIIQFLLLIFTSFGFLIHINKEKVYGYSCASGYYCYDSPESCGSGWDADGIVYGCNPDLNCFCTEYWWDCCGTDTNCFGGKDLYSTKELCEAGGSTNIHTGCCNKISCTLCTPGSAPSCPTGTTEGNTGDDWGSTSTCCNNSSGCSKPQTCDTRDCDCEICTITCDAPYSSTAGTFGSKVFSCRNGTSDTPNRDKKCSLTEGTCYCTSHCTPPLCPDPLLPTATTSPTDPNMILDDLMKCENDCSVAQFRDCWETPSPQPTESLVINNDAANFYGFSSATHSGIPDLNVHTGNLNDPINMVATFSDNNGASDIEGLFVWFRDVGLGLGVPNTPVLISTTTGAAKAPDIGSWGFMMRKEGTNWVPYIPNYIPSPNNEWKKTSFTLGDTFYIKGPDGNNMVRVKRNSITSNLTNVVMDFSIGFSGDDISTMVKETTYNILLMGLDEFSFTPYDNYSFTVPVPRWDRYWKENQLRYRESPLVAQTYAKDWSYSNAPAWNGNTWTVDKKQPDIAFINDTPSVSGNSIVVEWRATDSADGKGLYAVVGNIFLSAEAVEDRHPITLSSTTPGVLLSPTFTPITDTNGAGKLDSGWAFKILTNGASSNTGKIYIDIGANRTDSIVFFLTVFDNAGNMNPVNVSELFDLNDWFVTDGGLAYSKGGASFKVKDLTGMISTWEGILPPFTTDVTESLIPSKADYSSEMWGEGDSAILNTLFHSDVTNSFSINNFKFAEVDGYYDTLMKAYEKNKGGIPSLKEKIIENDETLSNKLTTGNLCHNLKYCVLNVTKNVVVSSDLNCDTKAVIFVGGDLTINPPFTNSNFGQDGCIFVVNGDVMIKEGTDAVSSGFAYDQIDAFILADGKITIGHELLKVKEEESPEIIDNADVPTNWYIVPGSGTDVSHSVDKAPDPAVPEGGSVQIDTDDKLDTKQIDYMGYASDAAASAAYVASTFTATGGTKYTSGGYNYHKFTANGVFTVPVPISVEALVVGGGGGGAGNYGNGGASGGGAGGVIKGDVLVNSTVSVVVGAGGAVSSVGKNSVFSSLVGYGGGGGTYSSAGGSGGNGGGGVPAGIGSQGYNGGLGHIEGNLSAGGGGGGAGSKGKNGISSTTGGGAGGAGTNTYSTWLVATSSGVSHTDGLSYIAGGGGGGDYGKCTDNTSGLGGLGGGGRRGSAGVANTGGGGGGACEYPESKNSPGGAGGSGLVLVRYPNTAIQVYSEASIKQQGSYALKVFAPKDMSLNQTITKTFATPINLSDYSGISFQLRSTRLGSNIKIGFKDSGGTITEITPNITVVNGYKEYRINLADVSNKNKDAIKINQIVITILNASEDNTFYIDDVKALISESQGDVISLNKYIPPKVPRDMSEYTTLTFYVKSTIAGQNMRFQFGEKTPTEQTKDIVITTAKVWQTVVWDISMINVNSRDRVSYFEFVITDALTPFTFWFDHITNGGAPPPDPADSEEIDGLYINGGLMSLSAQSPSIDVNRYLRLEERLSYPVLAIDSHPKYGELARTFFGSNFRMQKTEVGFKPY